MGNCRNLSTPSSAKAVTPFRTEPPSITLSFFGLPSAPPWFSCSSSGLEFLGEGGPRSPATQSGQNAPESLGVQHHGQWDSTHCPISDFLKYSTYTSLPKVSCTKCSSGMPGENIITSFLIIFNLKIVKLSLVSIK